MSQLAQDMDFQTDGDDKLEPLSQLALKRRERDEALRRLEREMSDVFEQKVRRFNLQRFAVLLLSATDDFASEKNVCLLPVTLIISIILVLSCSLAEQRLGGLALFAKPVACK